MSTNGPGIVRVWSARAERAQLEAYLHHFRGAVQPALAALPGFLGATVLWNDGDAAVGELVVVTRWRSMAVIRAFAGDDPAVAVVEPAVAAVLDSFDRHVRHYEIVLDTSASQ